MRRLRQARTALKKIKEEKFNVYLIDVKLPDIEGTELLLNIPNRHGTVKIIITGFSTEDVGKRAADYGADDFLSQTRQGRRTHIATVRDRLEHNSV